MYHELGRGSRESLVNHLWTRILRHYFPESAAYGIDREVDIGKSNLIADICLSRVRRGQETKLVLIENKRVALEGQSAEWRAATLQVQTYLTKLREEQNKNIIYYAIVTVGRYSQFFILNTDVEVLETLPGTDGTPLEFKENEMQTEQILLDIKTRIH